MTEPENQLDIAGVPDEGAPAVEETPQKAAAKAPQPAAEKAPKGKKNYQIGRTNIQFNKVLYPAGGIIALTDKEADHLREFIVPS